MPKTDR